MFAEISSKGPQGDLVRDSDFDDMYSVDVSASDVREIFPFSPAETIASSGVYASEFFLHHITLG